MTADPVQTRSLGFDCWIPRAKLTPLFHPMARPRRPSVWENRVSAMRDNMDPRGATG